MAEETFLPIKVVFKQESDNKPRKQPKFGHTALGPVSQEDRNLFVQQVQDVKKYFAPAFAKWPGLPVVAKVTLKSEAIAKTHRPNHLFNVDTCPIIGGGKPGELYASASPAGLDRLTNRLRTSDSKEAVANISTLSAIQPYTAQDALRGSPEGDLSAYVREHGQKPLKFRLFRHLNPTTNASLERSLFDYFRQLNVGEIEPMEYAQGLNIYALHSVTPSAVVGIAGFIGTQGLSAFPQFHIVRTASRALASVSAKNFPPPVAGREYGVVGIIDTGTDPNNAHLQAWVSQRHSFVPSNQQDHAHGSFVAGLIINPRLLNHGDKRLPDVSARIVDVVAIDNSGEISEYDLHTVIDDSLRRFPDVKVWNMSLALDGNVCEDDNFSEFGAFIDTKSKEHSALFHLPAGNYTKKPYRGWPPESGIGEADRICPPADSVRSIVVGSVAHRHSASSRVREGEPSPFSRRGPAGGYLIKPELWGLGGNCDASGDCSQIGILSIDGTGHIAESFGTSFACPPIASLSANIHHELHVGNEQPSPALIKALQLHAAFLHSGPPSVGLINYLGVGCPPDIHSVINCTKSAATCIFDIPVTTTPQFARKGFPIPTCLLNEEGGLVGEIFMTLYYDPSLDRAYDAEYCRANVTASLGVVRMVVDKKNNKLVERQSRLVNPVPKELDEGWEKDLIKNGYKWSPLKLYYNRFRGGGAGQWQLQLELLRRDDAAPPNQRAFLIVTIRDPLGIKHVYNEWVQQMNKAGWIAQDLRLRSRPRIET